MLEDVGDAKWESVGHVSEDLDAPKVCGISRTQLLETIMVRAFFGINPMG